MPSSFLRSFVFLFLFATTAFAQSFRFVHTSDTHVNPHRTDDSNAARNEKLFKEISALDPKPALAINTGDVVEVGSALEYGLLQERLKSMTVPYYHAPGNHDVRWNPLGKEGFVKGTGQPLYQHIEHDGVHFFLLDSTVLLEHWGHISQQQLDWLKTELEKIGTEAPVILAFHHWVGRDKVQVDNEQDLIDLVEPYNVVLWLQGHGHSDLLWNINGVPAVMQKGLYQGSYCVIDVSKDKLTVSRRSLGAAKKNELVRDKSVPETAEVVWTKVGEWPMKRVRLPRPSIRFGGTFEGDPFVYFHNIVQPPADAKVEFRINGGPFQPMELENGSWRKIMMGAKWPPDGNLTLSVRYSTRDGNTASAVNEVRMSDPAWVTPLTAAVQSRLIRTADAVYVTTMAGELVKLNPNDGAILWRYKTGDSVFSAAHIEGDIAYIGSADHHIHAVRCADGSPVWKFKTDGAVLAGASVAKNTVCIGSADTTIYGLNAQTGELKWKVQGANLYQSKTATDGERFFVGGWDNYFRCIDAETGSEIWKKFLGKEQRMLPNFSAFAPAITSPTVSNEHGLVFISTNDGILHALDTKTGEEKWRIDRKKMGYSSPLYHDDGNGGVVYGCLSEESKVFAADAATGAIKWEHETGHVVYDSSFCWANGLAVIGCVDGTVIAYNAATGEKAWEYKLDHGHLLASPAADDKFVYIASMLGRVTAIPIQK